MDQASSVTRDELRCYARRFINRWDTFLVGHADGRWRCVRHPLSETHLQQAVAGRLSLGTYAVSQAGFSRWACLDLDDQVQCDRCLDVIAQLSDPGAAVLEASRRGFHVWLLVEPSPWLVVQHWARHLADKANLTGIEVFPKHGGLNGVRLPLSRHPKTGEVYPLLDVNSGAVVIDPIGYLNRRHQIARIEQHLETTPSPPAPMRERRTSGSSEHRALVTEIERYTSLRFYGAEQAVGRCPLHDDHQPSLGVVGGFWRCFAGCGEGGLNAFRARMRELRMRP